MKQNKSLDESCIDQVKLTEGKRAFFLANPDVLNAIRQSPASYDLAMQSIAQSRKNSLAENTRRANIHNALNSIGMLTRNPMGGVGINPGIWHVGQKYLREWVAPLTAC